MTRTTPPFRADHVGSLLRPQALKEARAKREKGEISPEALREIEDREIEKVIRKQEDVGLQSVTDGEHGRTSWSRWCDRLGGGVPRSHPRPALGIFELDCLYRCHRTWLSISPR